MKIASEIRIVQGVITYPSVLWWGEKAIARLQWMTPQMENIITEWKHGEEGDDFLYNFEKDVMYPELFDYWPLPDF